MDYGLTAECPYSEFTTTTTVLHQSSSPFITHPPLLICFSPLFTTFPPLIITSHYSSTTHPPPIHHPSTTHPPLIHHPSTTHPPSIQHPSTTHPPPIHHSSTTHPLHFFRQLFITTVLKITTLLCQSILNPPLLNLFLMLHHTPWRSEDYKTSPSTVTSSTTPTCLMNCWLPKCLPGGGCHGGGRVAAMVIVMCCHGDGCVVIMMIVVWLS